MGIQYLAEQAEYRGELIRPLFCETCGKEKTLIRHHRNYDKPLEITWLCYSYHKIEHCANKELQNPENMGQRHPIQFGETLWELLAKVAGKESQKQGKHITPAKYARQIVTQNLKRKRII